MALFRTGGDAGASALTVTTSERQSTSFTIDLTDVKYVILAQNLNSTNYPYVYDVEAGSWNMQTSGYTINVSGNTMSVTSQSTYNHYVTMS